MPPRNNQVWAPLYQPGSGPQTQDQQGPGSSLQTSGTPQQPERPYSPLPGSSCSGEQAHHRACPPSSKHIRAVQCSSYNNKPFMGRLYEWEPFNEVPEDQHCELNCRAVGFRFYVRQSEKVIDGTPCGQNETSLCVAGKCSVGVLFKKRLTQSQASVDSSVIPWLSPFLSDQACV
ncbi:Thrombospondin type-1 domain containing protein 4 [Dissostichus eleginoides]|uniref:Thrombospondin type-1 domain containing protein 4 n=1 Tax=Dissostichus eleginoides TaxID=100907 RepID=A0AAD9F3C3_DISEL|nr:Thrombospondin type-1 domain containing protein 4 [Dissostichus eleginoides]